MQVDHIDENTIRVRIDKAELARRGLKVLDLLGDKDQIQHFFYSILDEIDTDHSFSQDAPITFQVMPNNGGLDLLITKVTDKDRESLSHLFNNESNIKNKMDPRRSFLDLESDSNKEKISKNEENNNSTAITNRYANKQAYSFTDLDQVTELANSLQTNNMTSSLYFEHGKFYLDLAFKDENKGELEPSDAWAIANEYGIKIKPGEMARVKIIGKCLIASDALIQLHHYFNERKH
ncbi:MULTISPECIES: adaptor protein MecA [unclassified Lactobacillus]|uniref:adaptor protein MecA n=1 Tax=unclassified Lactobacillus TaxID=2620435 RepID=UPI000EFD90B0|nr:MULTISPECIES: adaptor protein MecA [unclassified Lactobacillus]RMC24947.1 adaptor protein MecA [Lactobacillus sp. ESL0247]RMC29102.1 adaptor protein MecA [Lactobacillus sp. ESL0246]RMC32705.1 adaptor protein MecA [Lactobacillus sp. ESL0245]